MSSSSSRPRVVVGLDFGTTYSGFAFAHISDPEKVYAFYDYPRSGGGGDRNYCKTLTGSYYKQVGSGSGGPQWQFKSWGYPARTECGKDVQAYRKAQLMTGGGPFQPFLGSYLTRFKLHLATPDMGSSSAKSLPQGLSVNVLITDYLREMGAFILEKLQAHYGPQLTTHAIQWCVTVPSIWNNAAKAVMRKCVFDAGLVDRTSPHPLIMVLEPEAASFACHKNLSEQKLRVGDKMLVADIGGGTADIVVQEVVSVEPSGHYRVREVTTSSGGLCGGTYVDKRFIEFMHATIGPSMEECINENVNVYAQLTQEWETRKTTFGLILNEVVTIDLPAKLGRAWEQWDKRKGNAPQTNYDEVEISYREMQCIFDPVVDENLKLISHQLSQAGHGVEVLVVVGGFSGSAYLMDRIRSRFGTVVPHIISPPNPGSAVCQGAVMLALNPNFMVSRVCKKTYGIEFCPEFDKRLDLRKYKLKVDGKARCSKRFEIYVRKGEKVEVDSCISRNFRPLYRAQKAIKFQLFSSTEKEPRYTDELFARKEGEIEIDISADMALDKDRQVKVSLYFGGSTMEVKAQAINFCAVNLGSSSFQLPVAVDFV